MHQAFVQIAKTVQMIGALCKRTARRALQIAMLFSKFSYINPTLLGGTNGHKELVIDPYCDFTTQQLYDKYFCCIINLNV